MNQSVATERTTQDVEAGPGQSSPYISKRSIVALVHEMEVLLADNILGALKDRALLLSYQALCANSPVAAIRLQEQALSLLPNITADNALLASNIHANLGGMYRESGSYIKAKEHMEASISLLRQYDLLACHDSIPQIVNYALLLSEMGQPDKAIVVLEQVGKVVQEHNSAVCMDTAAIHEAIGNTYLMTGNVEQAAIQHRKCLAIYHGVQLQHAVREVSDGAAGAGCEDSAAALQHGS